MNKTNRYLLLLLILAIGYFLLISPQLAFASSGNLNDDSWRLPDSTDTFDTVREDQAAQTAPAWLQRFSDGISIDGPEKICYPFRGGQFDWVLQIMQLKEGKWLPVRTTNEYLDGIEGKLYACAETKTAGTFVLFGYYNGPMKPKVKTNVTPTLPEEPTLTPEPTETEEPIVTDPATEEPTETEVPLECPPGFMPVGEVCVPVPHK